MLASDGETAGRTWQVWIDTGGTFTDCVAVDETGSIHREKILSTSALRGTVEEAIGPDEFRVRFTWKLPADFIRGFEFRLLDAPEVQRKVERFDSGASTIVLDGPLTGEISSGAPFEVRSPEEAPILAARLATGTPIGSPLPSMSMRLASTRGTNALLERKGARVVFFVTEGFADLLRIGTQQRPDLFALNIRKPEPLYETVVEVRERIGPDGAVMIPLDLDGLTAEITPIVRAGIRSAAVALMHSYANPKHEHDLAEFLLKSAFHHVSCSSDLAPFIKFLPRAETAVADSYLSPVIGDYLDRLETPLSGRRLHVMTSAGGLTGRPSYRAKDSLLSGPAAGVVGAVDAGRRSGFSRIIAFDMGGTSTDVARFDGDYDYVFEHEVGGAHLVAPALAVESVASGGGSICRFDGSELRVGPESAGADPGPACYGAGGPLTLTDVNLLLGRLDPSRFGVPIHAAAAERSFETLLKSIARGRGETIEREKLLEGLRDIANERMADAIRRISARKGYDPNDYALVAFGGAGGQHACGVAERLGVERIAIPGDPALLSALGLGRAAMERFEERQVLQPLGDIEHRLSAWIGELSEAARRALEAEGVSRNHIEIRRIIFNVRLAGQESTLQVEVDRTAAIKKAFESEYRTIFGYWPKGRPIEIESIRVVASSRSNRRPSKPAKKAPFRPAPERKIRAFFSGEWRAVPDFERSALPSGARIEGPALIFERYSVIAVETGWTAEVDGAGAVILGKTGRAALAAGSSRPEVVRLELFTSRFEAVAREMGEMLRRTAVSTNVKERLDYSCAVLDRDGELVVNAPHIPVHLGSIGLCVRRVLETLPMGPGDVVVTNHPAFGGSHLPDVTVVTPVHGSGGRPLAYVASRAHHAEIGGMRPGSMPPEATTLAEEGVVIPPVYAFKRGRARWETIQRLLSSGPLPSRAVEENMADLRAAVAANRRGAAALLALAEAHGEAAVHHYMAALKERAASRIRAALGGIPDGIYSAAERLDDGSPICASIEVSGDTARLDFTGCAGVHPKNLNATPAVVNSAVIYVLRLLVDEPMPLNEGLMQAITLHVPTGILNPPFPGDPSRTPAVGGGNVETSQRLVDCLLRALGLAACSQGTMNNVLFGTERYTYYETVCGGAGAGPNFHGASAVHTHMTNTRITDPEIIERRYPVRLERFAVRRNSGGEGEFRGGDGAIRAFTFLEGMSLSVLGQHRKEGPYGLRGGEPGKPALQRVVRAGGRPLELGSIDGCEVRPGDRFELETPGGGGYGRRTPPARD